MTSSVCHLAPPEFVPWFSDVDETDARSSATRNSINLSENRVPSAIDLRPTGDRYVHLAQPFSSLRCRHGLWTSLFAGTLKRRHWIEIIGKCFPRRSLRPQDGPAESPRLSSKPKDPADLRNPSTSPSDGQLRAFAARRKGFAKFVDQAFALANGRTEDGHSVAQPLERLQPETTPVRAAGFNRND